MAHAAGQGRKGALLKERAAAVIQLRDEVLDVAAARVGLFKELHAALPTGGKMRHDGLGRQLVGDGDIGRIG